MSSGPATRTGGRAPRDAGSVSCMPLGLRHGDAVTSTDAHCCVFLDLEICMLPCRHCVFLRRKMNADTERDMHVSMGGRTQLASPASLE